MRAAFIAAFLSFIASSIAYSVSEVTVKVGQNAVKLGEFNTQEIKQLTIESIQDKIDLKLVFNEFETVPQQLVVTLGNNKGLDSTFIPRLTGNTATLSIPVKKIQNVLKIQDKLFLNLIAASSQSDSNLIKHLVELIPSAEVKGSSKYKLKDSTFGVKPEIHHIFKEDPSTIDSTIPLIFIAGALVLFTSLLVAWSSNAGAFNIKFSSGSHLIYSVGFFGSLFGLEYNFVKYYLGQTIFITLFNSFILGFPSIYFGSKVLRKLSEDRKVGKV